jgi:hypothetical protein
MTVDDFEVGNKMDLDFLDLETSLSLDTNEGEDKKESSRGARNKDATQSVHCLPRKTKNIYRRAFSELSLLDEINGPLKNGFSYHCITGGDVDAMSYLRIIIREQDLKYCLLSTWCMAQDDVLQLREWIEEGKIDRLDCYVGEIFPGSYRREYQMLMELQKDHNRGGRICVFKNHSKIFAGTGIKFDFAIESSANINTNPRTENGCITIGTEIYKFYKDFFDRVKSFSEDFDTWEPYE